MPKKEGKPQKIDETDRRIIALLQEDARQSNAAIARIIDVSEATVRRRIKIMVDSGTLSIRAVPNPVKFGLNTTAMIGIDVEPDKLESVANALKVRDEVGFLGVSTGRYDLVSWVQVRDLDALRLLLEAVSKIAGVRKTETLVLLDVKKRGAGRVT